MAIEKYELPLKEIVPISEGGTGANTVAGAQTALGLNDAIVGLSVSGKTITYTQADGDTGTITTQDTTDIVAYNFGGASSYVKFSNGLIIQWGVENWNNGSYYLDVDLPISYPNNMYSVFVIDEVWNETNFGDSRFSIVRYSGNTGTGSNAHSFRVACKDRDIGAFNWFAIGY